jgi:peptidoglycan hydrolase-like protein with peptidoglycan-binding domain
VVLRNLGLAVGCNMKTLALLSSVIIALVGLSQPAQGGASERVEGYYYPGDATYDSLGAVPTVRQVQRALEEDGYYVGDNRGNFCYETRVAVRRYQRDKGLRISGKIDDELLKTLRLR